MLTTCVKVYVRIRVTSFCTFCTQRAFVVREREHSVHSQTKNACASFETSNFCFVQLAYKWDNWPFFELQKWQAECK